MCRAGKSFLFNFEQHSRSVETGREEDLSLDSLTVDYVGGLDACFTDAGLSGGALSLSGSTPEAVSSVKVGEHKVRTFVVVQENPATWENGWTPYKLVG
ncbi:hypothetical protein GQ457_05G005340 [Hibiscus cannabinus]